MTTKQSVSLVKNPNTKKAVAALKRYAQLESQLKTAAKEAAEATETIKEAMIEANVPRIEFDPELTGIKGYITLAERTNYKAEDISEVPSKFTKTVKQLDTDKVKAAAVLSDKLPKGVTKVVSQYISKKIEVVG